MKVRPLTLEQQRDYVRRLQRGWAAASADQIDAARKRSEGDKWKVADDLQQFAELFPSPSPSSIEPEEHGLVKQQRLFMRIHRRA